MSTSKPYRPFELPSVYTTRALNRERRNATTSLLAGGFPYSKKLLGHRSCVNTLALSSGDGRFLASGGDDRRILLWDFHQENVDAPCWTMVGPQSNIFKLAWSCSNRFLYSGGTDKSILKYDLSHTNPCTGASTTYPTSPASPSEINRNYEGCIRDISCHPSQDEVYLSGSEDGRIMIHDDRVASGALSRAQATLQLTSEVTGAQFHPVMEHIFATSDNHGQVCLRDVRMAFGPLSRRTADGIVRTYNTTLSKQGVSHLSNPEVSGITFDSDGRSFAVTMLHFYPTIYSVTDPNPLAICTGHNLPNGEVVPPEERTYSNSCTMKHGTFGGFGLEKDEYYAAPSDDFRAYVWRLPELSELADLRSVVSASDWPTQDFPDTVGFAESLWGPRYIPVELSTPFCRLTGHQSIVNDAVIHPSLLWILTSGIERDILVHSPTSSSPCLQDMSLSPTTVRDPDTINSSDWFLRAVTGPHLTMNEDEDPQPRTIEVFDHILREEGNGDVFALRRWPGDLDSDSDEDSNSDISF